MCVEIYNLNSIRAEITFNMLLVGGTETLDCWLMTLNKTFYGFIILLWFYNPNISCLDKMCV